MEQRWTVDREDDAPSGDLEFWAIRHGMPQLAANQNDRTATPRSRKLVRAGLVVLAAVAVGVAL